MAALDLLFKVCGESGKASITAGACDFRVNGARKCYESGLEWYERLSGESKKCTLRAATIGRWQPSHRDAAMKKLITTAIRADASAFAKAEGDIRSVICNDFDVRDPFIFAVATVAKRSKNTGILFEFRLDPSRAPYCFSSRTMYEPDWDGKVVEKVMRQPIELFRAGEFR
ncbi:MAG: hypothetical protein KIT09_34690 [Bryobacteraceae bacterium]|nr:hypothetical protein [Bryobacteraceae bacterium]